LGKEEAAPLVLLVLPPLPGVVVVGVVVVLLVVLLPLVSPDDRIELFLFTPATLLLLLPPLFVVRTFIPGHHHSNMGHMPIQ